MLIQHAHPTLAEAFSEAVPGPGNETVHMMPGEK